MALTFCLLASGSQGNCLWVKGGGVELLVDCGLSARMTGKRLASAGQSLANVSAVLLTHLHGDHIAGAAVLARRHGLELHGTEGTERGLPSAVPPERLRRLPYGGRLRLGGLTLETIPTPHDAPQSVALRIGDAQTSLGVITDLGSPRPEIARAFSGVTALVLEMNHDLAMLQSGPYPEGLKRRIRGNWGHLSNAQGAQLLRSLLHPELQHVTLAHLSEHNNTEALAREAAEAVLRDGPRGARLAIARQHAAGEPVLLKAPKGQLALPF
jgi:phosphoribosyl 1,2-cyclic phosphodiesterase